MVVAFDNNVLCLFLHPEVDAPDDPATRRPVSRVQDRISYLVEQLRESRSRILIPTPVLAEFLTFATPDYLDVINSSAHFEVAPFDQRAAIEAGSAMHETFKIKTVHVADLELPPSDSPLLEGFDG